MKLSLQLACVLGCISIISAYDFFEGFLKQGAACFDVVELPDECDTNIAESFISPIPKTGINEPTTLVYLFTPTNPDKAEQLHECGGRLPSNSAYDPAADTEIFIHGYLDGVCKTSWMREMKEQLFQRGQYNVILIDWSWGNTPDNYLAGRNCRVVGEQVGFVIKNIMQQAGVGPEKFHVIGHSFGAITSGYVGRSVKNLRRITGLEPPFSPYKYAPPNERLTYRDAQIVDNIHTNAFQCLAIGIGDERPMGHADFYPNGGRVQPSCYSYVLEGFLKKDFLYVIASLLVPQLCNHLQVLQFYKMSINPNGCQYVGVASPCYESFINKTSQVGDDNWAVMGMDYEIYHRSNKIKQKFYLETTNFCPYYDDSYLGGKKFPFTTSCKV